MRREQLTQDHSLVWELHKVTNGSNVHEVNNLLCIYRGFIDIFNMHGNMKEDVIRTEKKIRQFTHQQRQFLFG